MRGANAPSADGNRPPDLLALRAGPLDALFDPATLFLRRVRLGQHEVVRAIYIAVRDRNWETVPHRLVKLESQLAADSFLLTCEVECHAPPIRFRWQASFAGSPRGEITCEFHGQAESSFLRNRIGFCVLHPIRECAGARTRVEHLDGSVSELRFPERIEPQIFGQASFHDLKSIAYDVAPDARLRIQFEGDTFEMEDQRNWTDASFKTYCTPLAKPFPVEVPAGTQIHQTVALALEPGAGDQIIAPTPTCSTSLDRMAPLVIPEAPTTRLPQLGTCLPPDRVDLTSADLVRLRPLRLSHLRLDLRLGEPDWTDVLKAGTRASYESGLPLELAIHLSKPVTDLPELAARLDHLRPALRRVLLFREGETATRPETIVLARASLAAFGVPIGGGTDAHFCELNRDQALGSFDGAAVDFVSWPVTPQVHAFDDLSLIENLEAQAPTVATARTFSAAPQIVSPITLRPRFNAVATLSASPRNRPLPQSDPRQHTLFAAAWTLGSLATLTAAGVESLTFFEAIGPRGILAASEASPSTAPDGNALPALLAALAPGVQVAAGLIPNQAAFLAVYEKAHLQRVLLASLLGIPARLEIVLPQPCPVTLTSFKPQAERPLPERPSSLVEFESVAYGCHILHCAD